MRITKRRALLSRVPVFNPICLSAAIHPSNIGEATCVQDKAAGPAAASWRTRPLVLRPPEWSAKLNVSQRQKHTWNVSRCCSYLETKKGTLPTCAKPRLCTRKTSRWGPSSKHIPALRNRSGSLIELGSRLKSHCPSLPTCAGRCSDTSQEPSTNTSQYLTVQPNNFTLQKVSHVLSHAVLPVHSRCC